MLARDLDEVDLQILRIIDDLDEQRVTATQRRLFLHERVSVACEIAEERARDAQLAVNYLFQRVRSQT
jgi:hypothetical protein